MSEVAAAARGMGAAFGAHAALFDFGTRGFVPEADCAFCASCPEGQNGGCESRTAHTYGCYEAERWDGLYVYYCPASLAFVATVVFEGPRADYGIVTGPMVMGSLEDLPPLSGGMAGMIRDLPQRTPEQVNALARVQWMGAMFLSGRGFAEVSTAAHSKADLRNTLYELTGQMRAGLSARYPIELEQRLQKMIAQGDKQGARELINHLLGALYFNTTGDFSEVRQRAKELIVLFSRASIEGGADVRRIFGQNRDLQLEIDRCETLDELSRLLVSVFYRFVGYVFDFGRFEHADILHKAVNYLRENLSERVTLEQLAQHVALSRSYLSTIFKTELGQTFTDYVNAMRIEKSKELLLDPELSLAAIADLVGYSDQSYFTKMFARLTGMSPGQYRKKRGQPPED